MKGLSSYGWAFLAALLLHGALFLGLNAAVRFRAPQLPEKAGPITLQLLILPFPEPESAGSRVLQSPAKPAALLKPEVEREAVVTEAVKTEEAQAQEPALPPEAEPVPQTSQVSEEATGELNTAAGVPETLEREVSVGTGANGFSSTISSTSPSPSISRDVVIAPRPLSAIDPLFPIGSRIRGEQGDVRFQIWISAAGRLERTQLLQTSGYPALDEAAERALTQTRFAPGHVNGSAVPGTLTITVRFRLER
jgi:protein TonB